MANSLLDLYTFPKKKEVSVYPKNEMYNLLYKENPSIATPEVEPVSSSDSVVAQTAIRNANTPAKTIPDFSGALPTPMTQPKPQNVMAQTSTQTAPYTPQTEFEKYWKTPVGTSKYNMPLDQFVKIAGLAAKYFDPQNPIANDLIRMGGEAYNERARREYEGPNVLLHRQLQQEQLRKSQEEAPKAWDIFYKEQSKLGKKPEDIVREWNKITRESQAINYHYTEDDKGNVSVFVNGQLTSGTGKGKDISKQVAYHTVDDAGIVHTFDKLGNEIGRTPGGKTKDVPGAAARANEDVRKEREQREWKTFAVVVGEDGKKKYVQENKLGSIRYADVPEGVDVSRIPATTPDVVTKLMNVKLAPKVKAAKEKVGGVKKDTEAKTTTYPEGTIIKNAAGARKIMKNGQWADYEGES